jgi:hypothetical protein
MIPGTPGYAEQVRVVREIAWRVGPVVLASAIAINLAFGPDSPTLEVTRSGVGMQSFSAVDAEIDAARAIPLADGGALYPLGEGSPDLWAWCETPASASLPARGKVLGWYGAHPLGSSIEAGLEAALSADPEAHRTPAVIAVDGCHSGAQTPAFPLWRPTEPADRPLQLGHDARVTGARPNRARAFSISGGQTLTPWAPIGDADGVVLAWTVCAGVPGGEVAEPNGHLLGYVGSGHLTPDIQRAIDDAEQAGFVDSAPWTAVLQNCERWVSSSGGARSGPSTRRQE